MLATKPPTGSNPEPPPGSVLFDDVTHGEKFVAAKSAAGGLYLAGDQWVDLTGDATKFIKVREDVLQMWGSTSSVCLLIRTFTNKFYFIGTSPFHDTSALGPLYTTWQDVTSIFSIIATGEFKKVIVTTRNVGVLLTNGELYITGQNTTGVYGNGTTTTNLTTFTKANLANVKDFIIYQAASIANCVVFASIINSPFTYAWGTSSNQSIINTGYVQDPYNLYMYAGTGFNLGTASRPTSLFMPDYTNFLCDWDTQNATTWRGSFDNGIIGNNVSGGTNGNNYMRGQPANLVIRNRTLAPTNATQSFHFGWTNSADDNLYGIGYNSNGQLGTGTKTTTLITSFTIVVGFKKSEMKKFSNPFVNTQRSYLLTQKGALYTTGKNEFNCMPGISGDTVKFTLLTHPMNP